MIPDYPDIWTNELGSTADYTEIEDTSDEDSGYANRASLFPEITSIDVKDGGIPPRRTDLNGLFKLLGDNIFFMQRGGVYKYQSDIDYDAGALVQNGSASLYYSLNANGPNTANGVHGLDDEDYWNDLTTFVIPDAGIGISGLVTLTNTWEDGSEEYAATPAAVLDAHDDAISQAIASIINIYSNIDGLLGIKSEDREDYVASDGTITFKDADIIKYNGIFYQFNGDPDNTGSETTLVLNLDWDGASSMWESFMPDGSTGKFYWEPLLGIQGVSSEDECTEENVLYIGAL